MLAICHMHLWHTAPVTAAPHIDLLATPYDRFGDALDAIGVPAVLAPVVFRQLYGRRRLPMTEDPHIGPRHAATIAAVLPPVSPVVETRTLSDDGTEKLVIRLADGARVETVLMPLGKRTSVCVSSQVGCAMACQFCATATLGLSRGLAAGEIVAQVRVAQERIAERGEKFGGVVFMGMGEPLQHYAATRDAIAIMTDRRGVRVAPSRVRVSTVGLAPRIRQLGEDFGGIINLALSLNAGTNETRRRLMPVTARYDMNELREAVASYPRPGTGRYVMIEYVLMAGVTDTDAELQGLVEWMSGLDGAMVNLIPFNPFEGSTFRTPDLPAIRRALHTLRDAGVPCKVRRPRGRDSSAACGQLALRTRDGDA